MVARRRDEDIGGGHERQEHEGDEWKEATQRDHVSREGTWPRSWVTTVSTSSSDDGWDEDLEAYVEGIDEESESPSMLGIARQFVVQSLQASPV